MQPLGERPLRSAWQCDPNIRAGLMHMHAGQLMNTVMNKKKRIAAEAA